jgi:hypothetical protein
MQGHNGYIAVNLGGRQRGIKFGMYAITLFNKLSENKLIAGEMLSLKQAVDLIYSGMVNNCVVKQEHPGFSYEEVTDWVEELFFDAEGQQSIVEIINTFSESRAVKIGKKVAEGMDEDTKKKLMQTTGMTLNPLPSENSELSPANTTG